MKRIVNSQSGAALLLVLFVVLFLSIVGTVMLNTTTYSLKSIDQNKIEETEFYLLEGALDLALYDINSTYAYNGGIENLYDIYEKKAIYNDTELMINRIGTYFFIQDYLNGNISDSKYTKILDNVIIDGNEIKFTLKPIEELEEPTEKSKKTIVTEKTFELTASFVDKSLISSRKIHLKVSGPSKPVEDYSGNAVIRNDYIQSSTNLNDKKKIHHKQVVNLEGKYLGGINYTDKIKEYNLSIPSSLKDLTPNTVIVNSPSYYNNITASNKGTIVIPKNKIVYANSLNWAGQNRTLIVEGTLIINDFHFQSASTLDIRSTGTIIANSFGIGSNSPIYIFQDNTDSPGNGNGIRKYTSDVDWEVNNCFIIKHETVR